MSLIIVPTSGGYPTGGYSLPERVSFVIADSDGSGGTIYINGLGVTTSDEPGVYDLKKIFTAVGMLFNSLPLAGAFKKVSAATLEAVQDQLLKGVSFSFYGFSASAPAPLNLRFGTLNGVGSIPAYVPLLEIEAPNGGEGYTGDTWRVDINLRHSVTN
jgi:hypothetical protein